MGAATMPLITAGLTSGGNLLSTVLTNKSNQQNVENTNQTNLGISAQQIAAQQLENAANRQFNAEQSLLAFQRQNELWEKQANYYSPLNIVKRLQDAGINPAVFFGGGSATAQSSSPSVGGASYNSGLSPVMPNLIPFQRIAPQVGSDVIDAISRLSSSARDVAEAKKTNQTLDAYLESLRSSTEGQRIANSVQAKYGSLLAENQVQEGLHRALLLMEQARLAHNDGDLSKEKSKTEQAQQELNKTASSLNSSKAENMRLANQTFMDEFKQRMSESRARTSLASAQAQSENDLRGVRVESLRADIRMQHASAEAQEIVNTIENIVNSEGYLVDARRAELSSKFNKEYLDRLGVQEKMAIFDYIVAQEQYAAESTDPRKFAYWSDLLKQFVGAAGQAIQTYGAVRGAKR